ncbi:MAG: NAD-dependent epimerase/dehydratase family protein [Treponemataceae bacterium]|nr:NAD-dependent epimerase/dehydratase family protein [Treponemataceae bacterium]
MKLTIIGGSGFIGSRLCALLQKNNIDFIIVDKNQSPFFPEKVRIADIRDVNTLQNVIEPCDCLINLAAEHRDDVTPKTLYDEVNVIGSQNILKVCKKKSINHVIFTSSVAVYGFAPPNTDETGAIHYFNDYGRTKWEAEKLYRAWYEESPVSRKLAIIRPTVVFGERNRGNVYNLLKQIASGLFPMVGSGENVKSMAYVENVAAFIHYMVTHTQGYEVYNYIDTPDLTMNELVSLVKEKMGKKPTPGFHWPYWLGYLGGLAFDMLAALTKRKFSISRIRIKKFCATTQFATSIPQKTSFVPPVSLQEGLRRTIEFEFIQQQDKETVLFYSE